MDPSSAGTGAGSRNTGHFPHRSLECLILSLEGQSTVSAEVVEPSKNAHKTLPDLADEDSRSATPKYPALTRV